MSFPTPRVALIGCGLVGQKRLNLLPPGSVTVACTHDEAAGKVRIDVADDGPGIPPGDRDRLFEPYFSRREGGTGLGLAIVSAIANDHGGAVRMRDNTPRGTVFEMEFPVRPPANGNIGSVAPGIDDGRRGS